MGQINSRYYCFGSTETSDSTIFDFHVFPYQFEYKDRQNQGQAGLAAPLVLRHLPCIRTSLTTLDCPGLLFLPTLARLETVEIYFASSMSRLLKNNRMNSVTPLLRLAPSRVSWQSRIVVSGAYFIVCRLISLYHINLIASQLNYHGHTCQNIRISNSQSFPPNNWRPTVTKLRATYQRSNQTRLTKFIKTYCNMLERLYCYNYFRYETRLKLRYLESFEALQVNGISVQLSA